MDMNIVSRPILAKHLKKLLESHIIKNSRL
ncbi:MAG: hypothetical protein ACRD90_02485 [Nitrosopumilaceae archaeon]